MSIIAREELVAKLFFQRPTEKSDLLNVGMTESSLIALLLDLVNAGHEIEVTSVRTDHDDDSSLGIHSHSDGYAVDCWPLASRAAGDYLDAGDERFVRFLMDAAKSAYLWQIGLGGSAYSEENMEAAGPTSFHDNGQDHIHLGSNSP